MTMPHFLPEALEPSPAQIADVSRLLLADAQKAAQGLPAPLPHGGLPALATSPAAFPTLPMAGLPTRPPAPQQVAAFGFPAPPAVMPFPGSLSGIPGSLPPLSVPISREGLPHAADTLLASPDVSAVNVLTPPAPTSTLLEVASPTVPERPDQQPRYDGLTAFVRRIRQTGCEQRPGGVLGLPSPDLFGSVAHDLSRLAPSGALDVAAVRRDFPILQQRVHGQPLAWLDNAATTQKPRQVIEALSRFYATNNSNIHRGAHTLAARATEAYEQARETVRRFLNAAVPEEIVFVRGTTEGINLVAQTFGPRFLQPGDEILLSVLEHHANIVPWQMVARQTGAHIRSIPVNDRGEILLGEYERLLGPRTRLVGLTHASNSLGTLLPIAEMTSLAHRHGARVLIDGAQTVAHLPVDVRRDEFDFFVFSGHKVFGPTGIGAVYARRELWEELPPWQGGGNMIREVSFEETTFADPPARFEAGTPNVADAVGLGVALDYVTRLGLPLIARHEHDLLEHATQQLERIPGVRLIGTAREKVGVQSLQVVGRRPQDVGRFLDQRGIAVRAGHHCAQPSLRRFGLTATVRPSFSIYNTHDEVDRLAAAVRELAGR
jgi:cysteine desulfurase/selenocysteine lyase